MRPATIGSGAIGGLLIAALLAPSMYLDVPRNLISDWTTAPREAGFACLGLATLAFVLVGMMGALTNPQEQAKGGAMAGLVAACVALLVVLPATGVMGHGPLIELVEGGRATAEGLKRAIVTSVVLTPGYQTIGAACLLVGGLVLGWLGGVIHDLWRGVHTRTLPALRPSPVTWLALLGSLVAIPLQLGATRTIESWVFDELGATPTWVGQAQLTAPLALGGVIVAVLCGIITRDAVIVFRKGQRGRGAVWMAAMVALLGMLALMCVPLYWRVLILPGGLLGILAVCVAPLVGAVFGWQSSMELETDPRIFQDVVGEGVMAGVLISTQLALNGVSAAAVVGLLSMPYRTILLEGAQKVDTDSLDGAIQTLFMVHAALPVTMASLAIVYMMVALPVWLLSRVVKG